MKFQVVFLDGQANQILTQQLNSKRFEILTKNLESFLDSDCILITANSYSTFENWISEKRSIINVNGKTRGAMASLLLSVDKLRGDIPVLIISTNSFIPSESILQFVEFIEHQKYEVGALCIKSKNPNYSYVRIHKNKIIEIAEKRVISNVASAGIFYFKKKEDILLSATWSFLNNQETNGSFYISPALNYFVCEGRDIGCFILDERVYTHLTQFHER